MKTSFKKLNRKVVWFGFTVPLWVKASAAIAWIIAFLIILTILGYMCVKLYEVLQHLVPTKENPNPTNQVSVIVIDPWHYSAKANYQNTNSVLPLTGTTTFVLSYGAPGPWIQGGTNAQLNALEAAAAAASPVVTVDTDSEYDFYLDFGSQWYFFTSTLTTNFDCFVTNDNGIIDNYCLVTNGDGTITDGSLNWTGTSTLVDSPPKGLVPLHTIIVERTTDFVQWAPIFTNAYCLTNAPQFYLDTNAPMAGAFYRTVDLTSP